MVCGSWAKRRQGSWRRLPKAGESRLQTAKTKAIKHLLRAGSSNRTGYARICVGWRRRQSFACGICFFARRHFPDSHNMIRLFSAFYVQPVFVFHYFIFVPLLFCFFLIQLFPCFLPPLIIRRRTFLFKQKKLGSNIFRWLPF